MKVQPAAYVVYLGLGANLGRRADNIRQALALLDTEEGVQVEKVSSLYETEPWGGVAQPPFLNAAAAVVSALPVSALLALCQRIETALGRVRTVRWGARVIDIDLLHVPGFSCQTPTLTLPHPYLTARAFVLLPLAEIAPSLVILGQCVADWAASVPGRAGVRRLQQPPDDTSETW